MNILLLHQEQSCAGRGSRSLQHPNNGGDTPASSRDAGAPTSLGDAVLPGTGSGEVELQLWFSPGGRSESSGCKAGKSGGIRHRLPKPWQRMLHLSPSPAAAQLNEVS